VTTPAGWYADPHNGTQLRWWDGTAWTDHVAANGATADAAAAPGMVRAPAALLAKPRTGLFAGRKALEEENEELRAALAAIGLTEREQIKADIGRLREEHATVLASLRAEEAAARTRLADLREEVVVVEEEAILQEVGIYRYSHPLDSAVAYKDRLGAVQARIKSTAKANQAVVGSTSWQVNGSAKEGARMVRDFSKLMLRAYNNEADNAVRSMKPHNLPSAVDRLEKARATISRLGKTMQIQVTAAYHELRIEELRLTADYLAKVAEEKDREREERQRLREEEQARREYEREKARLLKEAAHYQAALAAMQANGDTAAAATAAAELERIQSALDGVEARAANTRAGYVYVISNLGAFGERMVKVGMTRRLDPLDRVRELGDASVPFRYDVHAIIFSEDAVGLEARLHQELSDRRVNLVNTQREFFFASPVEVRDLLTRLDRNSVLSFDEHAEALEWRQSENIRPAVTARA
jgi:hypothetical protein